jgi:hypothetical protein
MARKLSSREYVMIGGLAIVAIAVYVLRGGGGFGFGGAKKESPAGPELGEAPVVMMADLAPDSEGYDPDARNLFDYYTPPPPKRVHQPPPKREPTKPRVLPPKQPPKPPPPRGPSGPTPPPITFKFIGILGPAAAKIAVFEGDDEEEMLLARAGDVVQKEFRLIEFGYESVVMGYVDERFKDKTTELRQQHR